MLKHMSVLHPAAKMLVDLSHAQDVEAGDGTTSVVVIAGSLLGAAERLLAKGMHIILCDALVHADKLRRNPSHDHLRVVPARRQSRSRGPARHVPAHLPHR